MDKAGVILSNTIYRCQGSIYELEELKRKVSESISENVRFRIETKHWYGYVLDENIQKEKSVLDLSKYTMEILIDSAIEKQRKRIDKLINEELRRRKNER